MPNNESEVACTRQDGTLNIHAASATCEVCELLDDSTRVERLDLSDPSILVEVVYPPAK